jgi:predicted dienelactone hydrolase
MLRKIALTLSALVSILFVVGIAGYVMTGPQAPAADSVSAQWLKPGPYKTTSVDKIIVDNSRETAANRDYPGAPDRALATTIWYPLGSVDSHPLIIHSHGFTSARNDLSYVAELLASHGYVVAAADYPLTHGGAPGKPNAVDVINQPADVSFLIDTVSALSGPDKPFSGQIDASRIGLMGYSLGGLTTELATYHPSLRDPRISAAVSIAGPTTGFTADFFDNNDIPFLMIAGSLDYLINFDANAATIPALVDSGALVTILGGTHLGFASVAEPMLRFMRHPDSLGCAAVLANLDSDPNDSLKQLGGAAEGIVVDPTAPQVCEITPDEKALHPGEQHRITSVAVLAFFESQFASSSRAREQASVVLTVSLPNEFVAANYSD